MSEFSTPFRVGDKVLDGGRNVWRIIDICDVDVVFPIAARDIYGNLGVFTIDGKKEPNDESHSDLIPPARPKLPDLPEGKEWHRPESITEKMIAEGWRPLLLYEDLHEEDEFSDGQKTGWKKYGVKCQPFIDLGWGTFRTKRPLPSFTKRVPLGMGDIFPGAVIRKIGNCNWISIDQTCEDGVYTGGNYQGHVWGRLAEDIEINQSIPISGKWNPEAWEKCYKEVPA